MTLQARLSRPALRRIVHSMEAVMSRFYKTGAGIKYLTRYPQEGRSSAYKFPELYGFYSLELQSLSSVKATDTGLRNLNNLADDRQGESRSGFLFIRILSHLLMGVACSCDLSHGSQCSRISQSCNAMPTRLRNGRMVSQLNTLEALCLTHSL